MQVGDTLKCLCSCHDGQLAVVTGVASNSVIVRFETGQTMSLQVDEYESCVDPWSVRAKKKWEARHSV